MECWFSGCQEAATLQQHPQQQVLTYPHHSPVLLPNLLPCHCRRSNHRHSFNDARNQKSLAFNSDTTVPARYLPAVLETVFTFGIWPVSFQQSIFPISRRFLRSVVVHQESEAEFLHRECTPQGCHLHWEALLFWILVPMDLRESLSTWRLINEILTPCRGLHTIHLAIRLRRVVRMGMSKCGIRDWIIHSAKLPALFPIQIFLRWCVGILLIRTLLLQHTM